MTTTPRAIAPSVNAWNADFLEAEYERFKADPGSVPPDLAAFFRGFDLALSTGAAAPARGALPGASGDADGSKFQYAVDELITAYREAGHLAARIDPFGRERHRPETLSLAYHGLSEADLDRPVHTGTLKLPDTATLRTVIGMLEETYCGSIGFEVMHVSATAEREWLLDRIETTRGRMPLTSRQRVHILEQLLRAEEFENFIGKRYPGDKRFSLEGSESTIPFLDHLINAGADLGVEEMVIGMAHRGRLNVLNNVMGKTYEQIFTEFEDNVSEEATDGGDVKYHRGYSGQRKTLSGNTVHLAMASNPSHLESVNAVVEGRTRAKQRLRGDLQRMRVIPVLIHGDGAVIGQGVVAEVLNMAYLEGFTTGGTVHLVINNLVAFTTSPEDDRSSPYCTDVGKMIDTPVFHVNGEDPEAVVATAQLAMEYRQKFKRDVFVDLLCYRKYGHNEQDEATFTQPLLYALIKKKASVLKVYAERLLAEGVISEPDMKNIRRRLEEALEAAQAAAKKAPYDPTIDPGSARWQGMTGEYSHEPVKTGVSVEMLREVASALGRIPEGFNLNPKLKALLESRASLPQSTGLSVSYADAETLAYGTLLLEGTAVRLTGQDVRRGTFSHRHAVLRDTQTGEPYIPLNNMREIGRPGTDAPLGSMGADGRVRQAQFCIYDSPLSEFSVLGYEYGYSLADPNMLVLWEAQFGDFANGAQVLIDQYLASGEIKWERWSGLVMLLPHGYEGAGPEHSSCRIERFLQLAGNDNIQIVYPSTGPQMFHLLRRQVRRNFRKPLIVATPKSMLRTATGSVEELISGRFQEVIDDPAFPAGAPAKDVRRVLLCSGKFYFELADRRNKLGRGDVAIVRVEQLYPLNNDLLASVLARYMGAEVVWAQEEPRNAGAFHYMDDVLRHQFGVDKVTYVGRETSATPATGSKHAHKYQQERLLAHAIGPAPEAPGGAGKAKQHAHA